MATTMIVTGVGRLTAAPEVKTIGDGTRKLDFTLAARRSGERTDFIDCTAWRATAEFIARYFSTGDSLFVTGELCTETYDDRNGIRRKRTWVNVHTVGFAGARRSRAEASIDQGLSSCEDILLPEDGDIPF